MFSPPLSFLRTKDNSLSFHVFNVCLLSQILESIQMVVKELYGFRRMKLSKGLFLTGKWEKTSLREKAEE